MPKLSRPVIKRQAVRPFPTRRSPRLAANQNTGSFAQGFLSFLTLGYLAAPTTTSATTSTATRATTTTNSSISAATSSAPPASSSASSPTSTSLSTDGSITALTTSGPTSTTAIFSACAPSTIAATVPLTSAQTCSSTSSSTSTCSSLPSTSSGISSSSSTATSSISTPSTTTAAQTTSSARASTSTSDRAGSTTPNVDDLESRKFLSPNGLTHSIFELPSLAPWVGKVLMEVLKRFFPTLHKELEDMPLETEENVAAMVEAANNKIREMEPSANVVDRKATDDEIVFLVDCVGEMMIRYPKQMYATSRGARHETYGELITKNFVQLLGDVADAHETFLDIGMGSGKLVCAAAGKGLRARGVELLKDRYEVAVEVEKVFRSLFQCVVGPLPEIDLFHGDIKCHTEMARRCDIVFANNFLFEPSINNQIEEDVLVHLKPGAVVLSTYPFGYQNSRTTTCRNYKSFSQLATTTEVKLAKGSVTWKDREVEFFIAKTICQEKRDEIEKKFGKITEAPKLKRKNEDASERQMPIKMARMSEERENQVDNDCSFDPLPSHSTPLSIQLPGSSSSPTSSNPVLQMSPSPASPAPAPPLQLPNATTLKAERRAKRQEKRKAEYAAGLERRASLRRNRDVASAVNFYNEMEDFTGVRKIKLMVI